MKGLETQVSFIDQAVGRILCQIDFDILSPTFGCADLRYWRDKTSDVSDMRRQEAMLTLALLYAKDLPGSLWKGSSRLKYAIEALLSFWCGYQYSDGSMDEWYKGERAFAAAAFSAHAVARTILTMKDTLANDILFLSCNKLEKTSDWLVRNNDLFKTNHQAVGVCALAFAAEALGRDTFRKNAHKKIASILRTQKKEGWFPEVGHMDIGYTFLTVEFVLMAMELWNDWSYIRPFRLAFDFASEWIHPELAIGQEYGVCHNIYLSHIAVILMSKFSEQAANLRLRLENEAADSDIFLPYLGDDLRLLRNSYQPLLAYDYAKKITPVESTKNEKFFLQSSNTGLKVFEDAALSKFSQGKYAGIFAPVSGGLLRLFGGVKGKNISDYGYAISIQGKYATNYTYNRNIRMLKNEKGLMVDCQISLVRKFMPSFWSRALLRLSCSTLIGSRMTRKIIDIIRKGLGTALNQSSGNISFSKSVGVLTRQFCLKEGSLTVIDKLVFKNPASREGIFFLGSNDDDNFTLCSIDSLVSGLPNKIKQLEITKRYVAGDNWCLKDISADLSASKI